VAEVTIQVADWCAADVYFDVRGLGANEFDLLKKSIRSFEHERLGPLGIRDKRIIQHGIVPQFEYQLLQHDGLHLQLIDIINVRPNIAMVAEYKNRWRGALVSCNVGYLFLIIAVGDQVILGALSRRSENIRQQLNP
jgi:hypothetical protein